jgi:hypothetical protein
MIIIFLSFIIGGFPAAGAQDLYRLDNESLIDLGASPDLDHWFCVTTNAEHGFRLIADGKVGEWYDEIDPFKVSYSRDGAHLAYVGTRNGRQVMVRDDREEKEYDKVCGDYELPLFSADGRRLGYTAFEADRWVVVCDGKESPAFDQVQPPVFSADGRHLVFAGRKGERWSIVLDGVTKAEHDFVESAGFLPDGSLMYVGRDKDRWSLVRGKTKGPAYDEISGLRTSRDDQHCAYAARTGEKWRAVLDGKPAAEYDNVKDLTFSPSGKRLAYAAGSGTWTYDGYWDYNRFDGSFCAVLDGRELHWGPEGYDVDYLTFSADEEHIAYSIGKIGEAGYVVTDTTAGPSYRGILTVVYAPAGSRWAYSYYQPGDSHFVALADRRFGPYNDTQGPFFSGEGNRLAYADRRGSDWQVAIDGVLQPDRFDRITYLRLSPDRQFAGLLGIQNETIRRVVYALNDR